MIIARLGQFLIVLGEQLQAVEGRKLVLRWARRLLWGVTAAYGFFLLLLFLSCRWVGEQNLTTAFLIFLPPLGWLLPLPLLSAATILFSWRMVCVQFLGAVAFLFVFMDLHFEHQAVPPPPHSISVLTFNRGESQGSLQPFKNLTHPDVIVLEDAGNRADAYLHSGGYSEFPIGRDLGQFTVLSKFPIESASLPPMAGLNQGSYPHAARFVLNWEGRLISLYAVHLPTPRDTLMACQRGAFLLGMVGISGTTLGEHRVSYEKFWVHQVALARALIEDIKHDPNPVLLAGDFNAPSCGHVHHLVASNFQDSHEAAGSGFGFSFPGETHNPVALFEPWLRIDYLYCDKQHWHTVWCQTEKERPSQHRAVCSCFQFLGAN